MNLEVLENKIIDCDSCERLKSVTVYPMPHLLYTESIEDVDLLIVGRNPGLEHDYSKIKRERFMSIYKRRFLKCRLGLYLIENLGIDLFNRLAITNICKCSSPENSKLESDEIEKCKRFLFEQIELFKPKIILTLGMDSLYTILNVESKSLIRENVSMIDSKRNIRIFAAYHPSYIMRCSNEAAIKLNTNKLKEIRELMTNG